MDFTQTRGRIVLLLGQCLVLVICAIYIHHIYYSHILPDKIAKETYRDIECLIVDKKLASRDAMLTDYRADFLVSYNVNSVQYNNWVSGNGLDTSFNRDRSGQQAILDQYQVGGTYTCYYNPDNAENVVLVLRHNWLSTFPLMVPSAIAIIIIYYLFSNIIGLILSVIEIKKTD